VGDTSLLACQGAKKVFSLCEVEVHGPPGDAILEATKPENFMGCFKDAHARDLKYGPQKNGYTLSTCEAACTRFQYIALQGSAGWCSCDSKYATPRETYTQVDVVECDEKRAWRNAVWKNSKFDATWFPKDFIGCFKENTDDRDLKYGPQKHGYDSQKCRNACKDYTYFALEDNGRCSCDYSYGTAGVGSGEGKASHTKLKSSECGPHFLGTKGKYAVYNNTACKECHS